MAKATGQITIVDYNDALTLTSFLSSNKVKTQLYNPDNDEYIPDWSTSPFLVLTASLFKAGSATDLLATVPSTGTNPVKSVTFYKNTGAGKVAISSDPDAATKYVISGVNNQILTVKVNEMTDISTIDYICDIVYTDLNTGFDIKQSCDISFSKVTNSEGLVMAKCSTPDGSMFKNGVTEDGSGTQVNHLIGLAELWRGSTVDTTDVTYQWYMQDSSVIIDEGGGIGWKKLTDTSGKYTGVKTNTITVYADAFTNIGVFKAGIKDEDLTSPTRNTYFWDTVTFIDMTDPYYIEVLSPGGNILKNGEGSTVLTAKVLQSGSEIDASGTQFTYKWYKYDKNGIQDPDFGGTGISYKTGKTLNVTANMVEDKATFRVEIE